MVTILWTTLALCAFAANSILCRLALGQGVVDPATFTVVRLVSGAVTLALLIHVRSGRRSATSGDWTSAIMLVSYAVPFSYAYRDLTAGTGALLLFGGVQITMIVGDVLRGRRPERLEWTGLFVAFVGLVLLTWPGWEAPDAVGAVLMVVAGASWGVYSLRGRGSVDPLAATGGNFWRAAVMASLMLIPAVGSGHAEATGLILAAVSGAVTSALGYVVWYRALRSITATTAAIAQLLVPLLAAFGGVVVLDETFTVRLFLSGTIIAAGVAIATVRVGHRSGDDPSGRH